MVNEIFLLVVFWSSEIIDAIRAMYSENSVSSAHTVEGNVDSLTSSIIIDDFLQYNRGC